MTRLEFLLKAFATYNEHIKGMLDSQQTIVDTLVEKKEWVGLTDEERTELWCNTDMSGMPEHDYGKAIEAKLKEKNT